MMKNNLRFIAKIYVAENQRCDVCFYYVSRIDTRNTRVCKEASIFELVGFFCSFLLVNSVLWFLMVDLAGLSLVCL